VLDCDYGSAIVTRAKPDNRLNLSEEELRQITSEDLVRDNTNPLNLKDESYLLKFLHSILIQRSRAGLLTRRNTPKETCRC